MTDVSDILLGADYATAPFFAVLDGAQFENLPDALREGKFVARSLYLDRGENNPEQVVTAPHLVLLDETARNPALRPPAETVPALLDLLGGRPAAVFWQCAKGEDALFRHLRGINMVLYPNEMLPAKKEDEEQERLVLFRHADANVIAQVVPALTDVEARRLFGPSDHLLWSADSAWGGCPGLVPAPPPGPGQRGHLALSVATVARIDGIRATRSDRRVASYLRRVAPEQTTTATDADLEAWVGVQAREAKALGIKSEAGRGRWCYMQLVTGGVLSTDPDVQRIMATPTSGMSQDQKVRLLLQSTIAELEASGR